MELAGSSDDEKGTDWRYVLDVMPVVLTDGSSKNFPVSGWTNWWLYTVLRKQPLFISITQKQWR